MKIIDIGVCLNNNDPQGIGRIRYRPYGVFKSSLENAIEYEEWDENDQFIAAPFLPLHVNIIPQPRQSVKIVKYDTDKDTQNVEYIAGPFTTPHDFGSETFTTQHKYTTYGGIIIKKLPAVRDEQTGEYTNKQSYGALPKLKDNGLSGNYGSDVIFTENGLILRGGKLITKNNQDKKTRQKLQEIPLISNKMSKIQLKKFSQKMEAVTETRDVETIVVDKIKYIIEYELNNLSNPSEVYFYVYQVKKNYTQKYDTNFFNETTEINDDEVILITDDSIYTHIISGSTINELNSETRRFLKTIHKYGLSEINPKYPKGDITPMYYRPTENFRLLKPNNETEKTNKINFIDNVKMYRSTPGNGLYFSKTEQNPPIKTEQIKDMKLKTVGENIEQTFATTLSDYVFLLSTDSNKGENKSIDFENLDNYEYTQDNLLSDILPNTYALVRGETLIKLLNLIYKFLTEHVHNINDVPIYKPESVVELKNMINTMQDSLISQKIRIN